MTEKKPAIKKLMKFDTRTKILAGVTMAVISIFVFEKFFFAGLRTRIKNIDREIKLKEVGLKSAIAIQNKKGTIELDYKAYKAYIDTKQLSDAGRVANFLKELESIAQKTRVSIINLTPNEQNKTIDGNKVFYADMRVEASIDELYAFLNEIQNSKLLIKVDKAAISTKDEAASTLRVDTTVSMTVL